MRESQGMLVFANQKDSTVDIYWLPLELKQLIEYAKTIHLISFVPDISLIWIAGEMAEHKLSISFKRPFKAVIVLFTSCSGDRDTWRQ